MDTDNFAHVFSLFLKVAISYLARGRGTTAGCGILKTIVS